MRRLIVNRDTVECGEPDGLVLLDFLRRGLRLTGVKEGCREGDCGACLVLVGEPEGAGVRWRAVNSCLFPIGDAAGRHVVTVEGLNRDGLTPVQEAILAEGATQCGFCTPGFVVALTAWLLTARAFTAEEAENAAAGNLCRCTGYLSLRRACARLAERFAPLAARPAAERLPALIAAGVVPDYFAGSAERLRALAEPAGPPPAGAVRIGGGTDLFVQRPEVLETAPLHFLFRDPELRGIRRENGGWFVGAATIVEELAAADDLAAAIPGWRVAFPLISSLPIRERATIAGNLVNASPIADLAILLLPLDAQVEVRGPAGMRLVPLARLYRDYKKLDLAPDEIVRGVRFATPRPGARFHFEKVSRRVHLDIASVNSAALFEMEDGRIRRAAVSAGGVAPIPKRLTAAETALAGRSPDGAALRAAQDAADSDIHPISDVRGSASYKRMLLRSLLAAHFAACFEGTP